MDGGAISEMCDLRRKQSTSSCNNTVRSSERLMNKRRLKDTTDKQSPTKLYKMLKQPSSNLMVERLDVASRRSLILFAIEDADVKLINFLLRKTVSALYNLKVRNTVVKSENLDIIDLYIRHRLLYDGDDDEVVAETRAHRAVLVQYPERFKVAVFKLLLRSGVCIYSSNGKGQTVLHLAAERGYAKLIATLLEYDPFEDHPGELSTMQLRKLDYRDIAVHLNATNEMGETALHIATREKQEKIVAILINHGSDIDYRNIEYKTAQDLYRGDDGNGIYALLRTPAIKLNLKEIGEVEAFLRRWNPPPDVEEFYRACKYEVEKMMKDKIAWNLSVYDIVQKSAKQLAVYTKNMNTVETVKSRDWNTTYPIFTWLIRYSFKRAQVRERLMTISSNAFHCSIKYPLPPNAVDQILGYLELEDLSNFIRACQL